MVRELEADHRQSRGPFAKRRWLRLKRPGDEGSADLLTQRTAHAPKDSLEAGEPSAVRRQELHKKAAEAKRSQSFIWRIMLTTSQYQRRLNRATYIVCIGEVLAESCP